VSGPEGEPQADHLHQAARGAAEEVLQRRRGHRPAGAVRMLGLGGAVLSRRPFG
jgi:hypothetical protein